MIDNNIDDIKICWKYGSWEKLNTQGTEYSNGSLYSHLQ